MEPPGRRPEIVVVDIHSKAGETTAPIRRMRAADESLRILVWSAHPAKLYAERALRAGAQGYIGKEEPTNRVLTAIRRVLEGDLYLADVEAKKNEVEAGMGQCVAQMIGARLLNQRSGQPTGPVYGCVTTGEIWQFLRLDGAIASINARRYFLDDVAGILVVFQAIVETTAARSAAASG